MNALTRARGVADRINTREPSAMKELTRAMKRRIRELLHVAHERALSRELTKLESKFGRWHAKEIDAFELGDLVHRFHNDITKELFDTFVRTSFPDITLARAIVDGHVTEAEAGDELLTELENTMNDIRKNLARQ